MTLGRCSPELDCAIKCFDTGLQGFFCERTKLGARVLVYQNSASSKNCLRQLCQFHVSPWQVLTSPTSLNHEDLWLALQCFNVVNLTHEDFCVPGFVAAPVHQVTVAVPVADDSQQKRIAGSVIARIPHPQFQVSHFLSKGNDKECVSITSVICLCHEPWFYFKPYYFQFRCK